MNTAIAEYLSVAAASTSVAIIVTAYPADDHPIVFVNQSMMSLTGYSCEEFQGRNCRFLQGPDTNPHTIADIAAAIASGRSIRREILNYHKNGASFWTDLTMDPIHNSKGQLVGFSKRPTRLHRQTYGRDPATRGRTAPARDL